MVAAMLKRAPTIEKLLASADLLEADLAKALIAWQDAKAARGQNRSLGYEPRDIEDRGAVTTISVRIRNGSTGFDETCPDDSYEAIVVRYPHRFDSDVVELATARLQPFTPTADEAQLEQRTAELAETYFSTPPRGYSSPQRVASSTNSFFRCPQVKAYVLQQAAGKCERCGTEAPFLDRFDKPYLEVHHVKFLALQGSDTVSNAVALCPNCHRAAHLAKDHQAIAQQMYANVSRLIPE